MKHALRLSLLCFATISSALAQKGTQGAALKPCVKATDACVEWLNLGSNSGRTLVYATYPLKKRNPGIKRALVIVHGAGRNADHYFISATASAYLADALEDTIIVAPAFHSAAEGCADKLQLNEISWSCRGDTWKSGGNAVSDPKLSSFDVVDLLLKDFADKSVFPNLSLMSQPEPYFGMLVRLWRR